MATTHPTNMQAWQYLLHSGIAPSQTLLWRQVYVVNIYSALGFVSVTLFGLLHIVIEKNPLIGVVELSAGGILLLNLALLWLTHQIQIARTIFLLTVLAMLGAMLVTGGTQNTGILWFFVFPIGAFFLTGKQRGLWWMAGLFGMVLTLLALAQASVISLPYSTVDIRQLLATLLVVTVGIFAYQQSREQLEHQREASQQDLQEEKLKAETILENIDEGVVATDNHGRVVMMNKAAEDLFGWKFKDLSGKEFTETVLALDEQGHALRHEDRPMQVGGPIVQAKTATFQRKNGTTLEVAVARRAIIVDDTRAGAIATFRDVTEQRAIDRTKSELVTLVSHQLRTPLAAISWFGEMLLSGDAGRLGSAQREYIEQIYHSNQRASAIVDDMLMVSNLELGSMDYKPVVIDVPELTHRLLGEQLQRLSTVKGLKVSETYAPNIPKLEIDPRVARNVISNLLSNAIKYTPNGGTITVSVTSTDKALSADSRGSIRLEIADTGYGIPRNEQKKIFAKLFRGSNIKSKDTDGTGLGLYIVRAMLQQIGGTIQFVSEENKGSTFTVLLPLEGMKHARKPGKERTADV